MKHSLLAIGVLLSAASGFVSADYLVLVGRVGATKPVVTIIDGHATNSAVTMVYNKPVALPLSDSLRAVVVSLANGRPMPTVAEEFNTSYKEVFRGSKPPREQILKLADWTLAHGLLTEFDATMAEFAKWHPGDFVDIAYRNVLDDLNTKRNRADDRPAVLRQKFFGNYKEEHSAHYTLLYDSSCSQAAVQARLYRLEEAYRSFFYWFALKSVDGKTPPPPHRRLVAVLMSGPPYDEFQRRHDLLDPWPRVADGFWARRENLLVFVDKPLDPAYEPLQRAIGCLAKKKEDDELAKALFSKGLEEESARAAVTREATRQLLAATGLVPLNVAAPEWIRSGMASSLETPVGAAWGNIGGLHESVLEPYNYLAQFKAVGGGKGLDDAQAQSVLRDLITDRLFRQVAGNPDPAALLRARTMAWSLTYYLAHRKPRELMSYFAEVSSLPRDLDFDEDVFIGCFARAFDLENAKQPGKLDGDKLAKLAGEWQQFFQDIPFQGRDTLEKVRQELSGP